MNSAEQEEINRLNEQLEAVTQKAREATEDAKKWMVKYNDVLVKQDTDSLRAKDYDFNMRALQRTNVKLEDRIDALVDVITRLVQRVNDGD